MVTGMSSHECLKHFEWDWQRWYEVWAMKMAYHHFCTTKQIQTSKKGKKQKWSWKIEGPTSYKSRRIATQRSQMPPFWSIYISRGTQIQWLHLSFLSLEKIGPQSILGFSILILNFPRGGGPLPKSFFPPNGFINWPWKFFYSSFFTHYYVHIRTSIKGKRPFLLLVVAVRLSH